MQRELSDNAYKPIYFSHFQREKSTKCKHVPTAMLQSQTTSWQLWKERGLLPGAPRSPSGLERLWLYLVSEWMTDTDTCRFVGLELYSESALMRICLKKTSSVKVLFTAEAQSVCEEYTIQYTPTCQYLIIHKYLQFANQSCLLCWWLESNARNPLK